MTCTSFAYLYTTYNELYSPGECLFWKWQRGSSSPTTGLVNPHTLRDWKHGRVWVLTAAKSLTAFPLHGLVQVLKSRGHCADMHVLRELTFPALERIFWSLYRLALGKRRHPPLQRGENNLFTRHSNWFKDQYNFCSFLWLLMRTVIMVIWENGLFRESAVRRGQILTAKSLHDWVTDQQQQPYFLTASDSEQNCFFDTFLQSSYINPNLLTSPLCYLLTELFHGSYGVCCLLLQWMVNPSCLTMVCSYRSLARGLRKNNMNLL